MNKFNIGDTVRIINPTYYYERKPWKIIDVWKDNTGFYRYQFFTFTLSEPESRLKKIIDKPQYMK